MPSGALMVAAAGVGFDGSVVSSAPETDVAAVEANDADVARLSVEVLVWESTLSAARMATLEVFSGSPSSTHSRMELSSRLRLSMGTSNAFVTNFSSMLDGKPNSTIFLAFRSSSRSNFVSFSRYMVSSPASTVSHTAAILASILFCVEPVRKRVRKWGDFDTTLSRYSSLARKRRFTGSDP